MKKMIVLAGSFFWVTSVGWGDVTVVRHVKSSGFRGWGGSEGQETLIIKGKRSREENKTKLTGAMGKLTKGGDTIRLTLLDKSLLQTLHVSKKTYNEINIKDMMKKATQGAPSAKQDKKGQDAPPTHRITKSDVKVTATGQSKTINGYPSKEYVLDMMLEMEDLKTKDKTESRMVETLWTTAETSELQQLKKEEQAFWQAYAKEMGLDSSPRDLQNMGSALAKAMTGADEKELNQSLAKASKEMQKIKGFPVRTTVEWSMKENKAAQPKVNEEKSEKQDSGINTSGGLKGALGGFASKMASKQVEKKMKERQQAQEGKPVISVTSELESVVTTPVAASLFEVPAEYKKVSD